MGNGLKLAGITLLWLDDINIVWGCPVLQCIVCSCDQWDFHPFPRPMTVSLHGPNGRQMHAVRTVQGYCESVYAPTDDILTPWFQWGSVSVKIPIATDHQWHDHDFHVFMEIKVIWYLANINKQLKFFREIEKDILHWQKDWAFGVIQN